nr:reverse transcriptase domain-containing protein [Tanacetum cinerariifolium]
EGQVILSIFHICHLRCENVYKVKQDQDHIDEIADTWLAEFVVGTHAISHSQNSDEDKQNLDNEYVAFTGHEIFNKDKLFELANTLLNENFLTVLLKKLCKKLGDPSKFLILCDFPELEECLALADLGASINLMPLSLWKKLSLLKLNPTRMNLELANRSVAYPVGVAEDVFVKIRKFHFPANFVVVDYDVDHRVPLILGRPFLRTTQVLIDVHGEELTLRVNDEAVTFNVGHILRYSYRYDYESINRIDVIDVTCEEYAQDVLEFSDSSKCGNPTPSSQPIIVTSSSSLTPFEGGDFVLEEIEACLTRDSIPSGIDDADFDPEGDILLLEKLLNDDPSSPLPPKEHNFKELKIIKSSVDDPLKLELKDLPSHLEYAFLKVTNKLPVIIAKNLKDEEKDCLLKVLKSHKRAIAWKIFDIKGIDPQFCTHKILMEDDFKPAVQHQRRVNPKIHEVTKKKVIKLFDAGLIYPISDSPWIPIDPQDQEKTIFTCPYGTFAYQRMPFGLSNAQGTFQRCMVAIFHDMIEEKMEVFMDDFSVFGDFFSFCLSNLDKMLKRIEVDRAKVDVMAKLPHPTFVKGVRSFLGHTGSIVDLFKISLKSPVADDLSSRKRNPFIFSKECIEAFEIPKKKLTEALILVPPDWDLPFEIMCDASDFAMGAVPEQCKTKHFQPIHYASKTMTDAQAHYTTTTKELLAVVYAFEKLWSYLVLSKTIVYMDHSALKFRLAKQDAKSRLLRWILLLQEFDVSRPTTCRY